MIKITKPLNCAALSLRGKYSSDQSQHLLMTNNCYPVLYENNVIQKVWSMNAVEDSKEFARSRSQAVGRDRLSLRWVKFTTILEQLPLDGDLGEVVNVGILSEDERQELANHIWNITGFLPKWSEHHSRNLIPRMDDEVEWDEMVSRGDWTQGYLGKIKRY